MIGDDKWADGFILPSRRMRIARSASVAVRPVAGLVCTKCPCNKCPPISLTRSRSSMATQFPTLYDVFCNQEVISCGLTAWNMALHGVAPTQSMSMFLSASLSRFFKCGCLLQSVESTTLALVCCTILASWFILSRSKCPHMLQQMTPSMSRKMRGMRPGGRAMSVQDSRESTRLESSALGASLGEEKRNSNVASRVSH